jgi:hypothetical protein
MTPVKPRAERGESYGRRQAKGSTTRRAAGLGRSRGAFATRGFRPSARGRRASSARRLILSTAASAGLLTALALFASSASAADTCPNAALRPGPGAHLPDCRAYEQVSPTDKNGGDIFAFNEAIASSGDAISYPSGSAFAGSPGSTASVQYLSTRSASGWATQGITPAFTNSGGLRSDVRRLLERPLPHGRQLPGTAAPA